MCSTSSSVWLYTSISVILNPPTSLLSSSVGLNNSSEPATFNYCHLLDLFHYKYRHVLHRHTVYCHYSYGTTYYCVSYTHNYTIHNASVLRWSLKTSPVSDTCYISVLALTFNTSESHWIKYIFHFGADVHSDLLLSLSPPLTLSTNIIWSLQTELMYIFICI